MSEPFLFALYQSRPILNCTNHVPKNLISSCILSLFGDNLGTITVLYDAYQFISFKTHFSSLLKLVPGMYIFFHSHGLMHCQIFHALVNISITCYTIYMKDAC